MKVITTVIALFAALAVALPTDMVDERSYVANVDHQTDSVLAEKVDTTFGQVTSEWPIETSTQDAEADFAGVAPEAGRIGAVVTDGEGVGVAGGEPDESVALEPTKRGILRGSIHGNCRVPRRFKLDLHGHCVDTNVANSCPNGATYPNQCPGGPSMMCCVD